MVIDISFDEVFHTREMGRSVAYTGCPVSH